MGVARQIVVEETLSGSRQTTVHFIAALSNRSEAGRTLLHAGYDFIDLIVGSEAEGAALNTFETDIHQRIRTEIIESAKHLIQNLGMSEVLEYELTVHARKFRRTLQPVSIIIIAV